MNMGIHTHHKYTTDIEPVKFIEIIEGQRLQGRKTVGCSELKHREENETRASEVLLQIWIASAQNYHLNISNKQLRKPVEEESSPKCPLLKRKGAEKTKIGWKMDEGFMSRCFSIINLSISPNIYELSLMGPSVSLVPH